MVHTKALRIATAAFVVFGAALIAIALIAHAPIAIAIGLPIVAGACASGYTYLRRAR